MNAPPLEGVRILSLAEQYPGPFATMVMADLGADVIIVERPDGGDPSRRFPAFFETLNRNKRSVALDLRTPEGLDACLRLVDRADVWLEGFRPGAMERLGLGYRALSARHPEIVYLSVSGFGQDGPYRDHPAHDLSYQGFAGLLHYLKAGSLNCLPPLEFGDLASGLYAVIGILSGLLRRATTGKGMHIDLAVVDSLISLMSVDLVPTVNGTGPPGFPIEPAYGMFGTADGQVVTLSIVHEDRFWQLLCGSLGLDDCRELSHSQRIDEREQLRQRISEIVQERPAQHWLDEWQRLGIPSGPVHSIEDLIRDRHVASRQMLIDGPDGRRFTRQPLVIGETPTQIKRGSPHLGEHTFEVLAEVGVGDEALRAILDRIDSRA